MVRKKGKNSVFICTRPDAAKQEADIVMKPSTVMTKL